MPEVAVVSKTEGQAEPLGAPHDGPSSAESIDTLLRQVAHFSVPAPRGRTSLAPGARLATGRFSVVRQIGEGGMGLVYEAFDTERKELVALKTLSQLDASGVYRLKNEFRSLANVRHSNLVRLHDLFADGEHWFFAMELVAGERFDHWVRPAADRAAEPHDGPLDDARLRAALPQLLAGIHTIHAAGKLHRDLKPSNVLVTRGGRVVVLDFGLAVDREPGGVGQTLLEAIGGTPAYMAPEQAAGDVASRASDYYALGVMLFEALTGRLPFEGKSHELLADKQRGDAPLVGSICPDAAPDLSALCDSLLARDPLARPAGAELAARIARVGALASYAAADDAPPEGPPLFGRDVELMQLRATYETSCAGQPVVLFLVGESGVGKSALLAHFLDELRASSHAAVLAGRCYERESVPFKGIDSVIDDLSRLLRSQSREEAAALLPREISVLARVFPVLGRIDCVANAPAKDCADPQELRMRAFAAFDELLGRIRDRRPLVLQIDDAQWLDRDAVTFLGYLFARHEPVPALIVLSHRREGADANPHLQLIAEHVRANPRLQRVDMALGALEPSAARQLARHLLGGADGGRVNRVAAQSRGIPFLLSALASHMRAHADASLTLEDAVLARVRGVSDRAQELIAMLAVADRPLPIPLALAAAGATHEQIDELRAAQLARTRIAGEARALECYHDRIRESVSASLAPSRALAAHASLLAVMIEHGDGDHEHLALHAEAAGDRERAARFSEQAARAAGATMAFERAVSFWRHALELGQHDGSSRRELLVALGDALANAGRGEEAARAYLEAAVGATEQEVFELERRAAKQLLNSGHIDEGKALLDKTLRAVGLKLPASPKQALAAVVYERIRLKLRGTGFRERETELPLQHQRELDALWTAGYLSAVDLFTGAALQARFARRALDSGVPSRASIALGSEALSAVITRGADARDEANVLLARAEALAEASGDDFSLATLRLYQAVVSQFADVPFDEVRRRCMRAISALRQLTGVRSELTVGYSAAHGAAEGVGQLDPAPELAALVDEAWRRGDLYSAITLTHSGSIGRLIQGDVDGLARHIEQARRAWRRPRDYSFTDYHLMTAEHHLLLYRNLPGQALECMQRDWPAMEKAELFRAHTLRYATHGRRARAAFLAADADPAHADELRALARRDLRVVARIRRIPHAVAVTQLITGMKALSEARTEQAIAHYRAGVAGCKRTGHFTTAFAVQRPLGVMIGGDEGITLTAEAEARLNAMGSVDHEATLRIV